MGKSDNQSNKPIQPNFIPDPTLTSNRIYANFVRVTHTGLDFTLSFADVLPPTKDQVQLATKGQEVRIPLQCSVVVPNDLVPALIEALQDQYGKFQENVKKTDTASSEKVKGE